MSARTTQFTRFYVVFSHVGKRSCPSYGWAWQFHSVHDHYEQALKSSNGWRKQGGNSSAVIFEFSQADGWSLIHMGGPDMGSHEYINAHEIPRRIAAEQYWETMRNLYEQATGRDAAPGSIRAPMDVFNTLAVAADQIGCADCGGPATSLDHEDRALCDGCAARRGHDITITGGATPRTTDLQGPP